MESGEVVDIEELKMVTSICSDDIKVYVEIDGKLKEVKDYEYCLEDGKFVLKLNED